MQLREIGQWGLTQLRTRIALAQLIGVLVCIPPLIFPSRVPGWVIYGSLLGLSLLLIGGHLLSGRSVVHTPIDIPIRLLLLLLPVTVLITPDSILTLPHVYKVIGSVAVFYGVVGLLDEKPWFGWAALILAISGLVLATLILFGTRWDTARFSWLPIDPYQLFPRKIRTFWNPLGFQSNIAGGTLAMLLPVPIAFLFFSRRCSIRLGAALVVGGMSLVLLLTKSRGAMGALLAGVAVMLVAHDRRWLVVGILLTSVGVAVFQFAGVNDLGEMDSYLAAQSTIHSVQGRMELWSRGLMMLQDFAFTGVGFGLVVKVMPSLYPTFVVPNDAGVEHVHNLYLEAGVDLGFPGLIVTLAFLLGLFHIVWCAAQQAKGTELKPLASAMLGTVVVFAAHGLIDNLTFYAKAHFIAWALFGVAVAVGLHILRVKEIPDAEAFSRRTLCAPGKPRTFDPG